MSYVMSGVLIGAKQSAKDWNADSSTIRKYSAAVKGQDID